jgi:uncharacterized membrane protein
MSRGPFLARLRQGLHGLPPEEIHEIAADYEAHFTDALEAGRSEADVAASLGDPLQLGRELRMESKLRRWEDRRNPQTFLRAGVAMLQAFNVMVLLPVLLALLFCVGVALYVLYIVAGTGLQLASGVLSGNGNVLVPALVGMGLIFGVIATGAFLALLLDGGMRLLARYARLNYRLLKPDERDGD